MAADAVGFWSYVHKDDQAEKGRIAQLAHDLVDQYEMITGETIKLFYDRDSIEWGDNWRARIDEGLATAAFFVAVLSPRYFTSSECRRELQTFAREAQKLGISDLILSINYIDVPGLEDENPQDELMALLKKFQWQDWRQLRFSGVNSSEYRMAVAQMATKLADASRAIITAELSTPIDAAPKPPEGEWEANDQPGLLDILASGQTGIQDLGVTSKAMTDELQAFGEFAGRAVQEIARSDQEGKGAVGRLAVARELAQNISEPAQRFLVLASKYSSQLYDADAGVRTLISMAGDEVKRNPESRDAICEFFKITTGMAQSSHHLTESLGQLSEGMNQNETFSRDLRPPLQAMRKGIAMIMETTPLTQGWVELIEQSPVDCTGK